MTMFHHDLHTQVGRWRALHKFQFLTQSLWCTWGSCMSKRQGSRGAVCMLVPAQPVSSGGHSLSKCSRCVWCHLVCNGYDLNPLLAVLYTYHNILVPYDSRVEWPCQTRTPAVHESFNGQWAQYRRWCIERSFGSITRGTVAYHSPRHLPDALPPEGQSYQVLCACKPVAACCVMCALHHRVLLSWWRHDSPCATIHMSRKIPGLLPSELVRCATYPEPL